MPPGPLKGDLKLSEQISYTYPSNVFSNKTTNQAISIPLGELGSLY